MHEYILVGSGTVQADDPQLTGESPSFPFFSKSHSPSLIKLAHPFSCHSFNNQRLSSSIHDCESHQWPNYSKIATISNRPSRSDPSFFTDRSWFRQITPKIYVGEPSVTKFHSIMDKVVEIILSEVRSYVLTCNLVPLSAIIDRLCKRPHCRDIHRSLMVEGGAAVISSFLTSGLVDLIIITIAPVYVGDGIGVFRPEVRSRMSL